MALMAIIMGLGPLFYILLGVEVNPESKVRITLCIHNIFNQEFQNPMKQGSYSRVDWDYDCDSGHIPEAGALEAQRLGSFLTASPSL